MATTEPMPKKAPWQRAVRTRAAEEEVVGGCDGAGEIAQGEDCHEEEQGAFSLEMRGGESDEWSSDGDRESVAGDQGSRLRDGDVEVGGEIGEQPHNDELGSADTKGSHGRAPSAASA